jgi:leucyl aminopeptidase
MTDPVHIRFAETDLEALATARGRVAVLADAGTALSAAARRLDRLTRGALGRAVGSEAFGRLKPGEALDLAFPAGLEAEAVQVIRLPRKASRAEARKAGAAIGRALGGAGALVLAGSHGQAA